MADDFGKQIKTLTMYFEKEAKEIQAKEKKFVTVACAEVERQAKTLMRDATVDSNKTYGKRAHHPSVPGSAPAPDSGELMRSVTHEVTVENGEVVGKVGSIIRNPDYPKFLEFGTSKMEFGTSKMKPRPWLSAALEKSQNFMVQAFQSIMGGKK